MKNFARNRFVIILMLFCMFFSSCTKGYHPKEGEMRMNVKIPAGTTFEYRDGEDVHTFLPFMVNEGEATFKGQKRKFGLIGKRLKMGEEIYVRPFAKLYYTHNEVEIEMILAVSAEEKYRTIEISDYDSFLTEHYSVKQIIEYWYANRYGLGGVNDVRWSAL